MRARSILFSGNWSYLGLLSSGLRPSSLTSWMAKRALKLTATSPPSKRSPLHVPLPLSHLIGRYVTSVLETVFFNNVGINH